MRTDPALPRVIILQPSNGGLSAARALARRRIAVELLATPNDPHTAATRAGVGVVMPSIDDHDAWIDELHRRADRGPAVLLCGSDEASAFLAEHRNDLPASFRFFERLDDVHLALMDKKRSYDLCVAAGVRAPVTAFVATEADVDRALALVPFPCVVKPVLTHLWRPIFGADRVLLAHESEQLRAHCRQGLGAGLELIVSEYVPGGDECVEEAVVVRAPDGAFPVEFGCHKLRQWPRGFGAASLCESAPLDDALTMTRALLGSASFVGVAGVEVKRHAVTGERYFIEANVRMPTLFGLGDACGADASWRMYAVAAELPFGPSPTRRDGAKLVLPELELAQILRFARGDRDDDDPDGWLQWLRAYRGTRDFGVLDVRDPGPGLTILRRVLRRRVGRLGRSS